MTHRWFDLNEKVVLEKMKYGETTYFVFISLKAKQINTTILINIIQIQQM